MLTGPSLNAFEQAVLEPFLSGSDHTLSGCVIDARPSRPLGQKVRDNLRRGRGGYVLVMALTLPLRRKRPALPTRSYCDEHAIPVIETAEPYSVATISRVSELAADVLVLIGGFGIVRAPLLELAPHGVLSYHHGDMRRYRGQPPGLWELYHGDSDMGVTVQRLTESLDAGEPIVERRVPIRGDDTVGSLRERALAVSVDMLYEAVQRIDAPGRQVQRIATFGPVYTLPNLRQWLVLQMRVALRRLRARAARG